MKELVVMKFGGTSVADPEKIHRAAERAVEARRRGKDVVVVVSAPGDMTDELIALAERVVPRPSVPDGREMDMLLATGEQVSIALFAMAVKAKGMDAVSLTGPMAGIEADARHTSARITRIRPELIRARLARGQIVAVAGFQGANPKRDIATLGRGGSDLSAVALAAALKARECEIFTDVKGVYTADPRVVPEARVLKRISYDEMLELASSGAQVMQPRSIEVARKFDVPIHVRSSFSKEPGTRIEGVPMEEASISSLALDKGEVRLTVVGVPDRPGVAARILSELSKRDIPVDMIVQASAIDGGVNHISLMTPRSSSVRAAEALRSAARAVGAVRVDQDDHTAKVSVIGTGFRHHTWVAARTFDCLAREKINLQMILTSDLRISVVVALADGERALRALHRAFGLGRGRRTLGRIPAAA